MHARGLCRCKGLLNRRAWGSHRLTGSGPTARHRAGGTGEHTHGAHGAHRAPGGTGRHRHGTGPQRGSCGRTLTYFELMCGVVLRLGSESSRSFVFQGG